MMANRSKSNRNHGKETVKVKFLSRAVMKEQGLGTCVFTREDQQNKNIARVMAKSRSGCRQSWQMCRSVKRESRVYRGLQHQRPQGMSGMEVQRFQHACRKGYRTYDN